MSQNAQGGKLHRSPSPPLVRPSRTGSWGSFGNVTPYLTLIVLVGGLAMLGTCQDNSFNRIENRFAASDDRLDAGLSSLETAIGDTNGRIDEGLQLSTATNKQIGELKSDLIILEAQLQEMMFKTTQELLRPAPAEAGPAEVGPAAAEPIIISPPP